MLRRAGRGGGDLPTTGGAPTNGNGGGGSGGGYYGSGYGGNNSGYGGYTGGSANDYGAGYGGAAVHMSSESSSSSSFKDKPSRRSSNGINFDWIFAKLREYWGVLLAILFFLQMMSYRSGHNELLKTLQNAKHVKEATQTYRSLERQRDSLQKQLSISKESYKSMTQKTSTLETEKRTLVQQVSELKSKHESPEREAEKTKVKTREDAWKNQVQLLQQATSRESRRAVTEKFGPGPHYVKITVEMEFLEPSIQHFTIQLAPLESMPHAVKLFMEQVIHGLWDNGWFYINGPHVMQAGPMVPDDNDFDEQYHDERSAALHLFRELQLDTLAFPEYSEDYPHQPYTLGFTGRPGGPDFYINKVDNTAAHGPGGQFHHELEEFADACFARVVDGFDTLKTMMNAPTIFEEGDYQYFLQEPIYIIKMRIVDDPRKPKPEPEPELIEHIDTTGEQLKEALKTVGTSESVLLEVLKKLKETNETLAKEAEVPQHHDHQKQHKPQDYKPEIDHMVAP